MIEADINSIGWCVIPPYIMSRADLSSNEKMLYGRILGLSGKEGYCFASNEWLGKQIGLTGRAVRAIIAKLKEKKLIDTEVDLTLISQRKIYPTGESTVRGDVMMMTPQGVMSVTPTNRVITNTLSKDNGQSHGMKKLGLVMQKIKLKQDIPQNTDKRLSQGWQYYALEVVKLTGFKNGGRGIIFSTFKRKNYGHFEMEKTKDIIHNKNYPILKSEADQAAYLIGAFKKG